MTFNVRNHLPFGTPTASVQPTAEAATGQTTTEQTAQQPAATAPPAPVAAVTIEPLIEYASSRGMSPRVDRRNGRIFGVKVLGLQSRNGRVYRPEAIAAAAPLYENVKVNVNHPKARPHEARDYQDRLGCLRNVRATADGLFGDLYFNPHHPLADQLAWDAEHAPENVGLSHNVQARTRRQGEQVIVEAIECVTSVDLVADPATTRGLYESAPALLPAMPMPTAAMPATAANQLPAAPTGTNAALETLASEMEAIRRRLMQLEAIEESRRYRPLPVAAPVSRGPEPPRESLDAARWARLIT